VADPKIDGFGGFGVKIDDFLWSCIPMNFNQNH
jgi:hypothetical protein